MNKNITKLLEKSNGCHYDEDGKPLANMLIGDDIEKFVELIVLEFGNISDDLKSKYLENRKATSDFGEKNIYAQGESTCDTLKRNFKKHFVS